MSAHTPGPWEDSCAPFDMAVTATVDGRRIDIMGARSSTGYGLEQEANMKLAAASPDMFEALMAQELAEKWIAENDEESNPFFEETYKLMLGAARILRRDAIAKATGEAKP